MSLRDPGQSKVGKRIVILFVLCALVPAICLGVVASMQVTGELRQATRQRLRQTAKSLGIEILDQLRRAESDLALIDETMNVGRMDSPTNGPLLRQKLAERFTAVALIATNGTARPLLGVPPVVITPTAAERAHLIAGKTVLRVVPGDHDSARLLMIRRLGPGGSGSMLSAQIKPTSIFNSDSVPPLTEVHVLGPEQGSLFTAPTMPPLKLDARAVQAIAARSTGETEWSHDGDTYTAQFWTLPLTFEFLTSDWKIVASASRTDMLAPIRSSRLTFMLVMMLSLGVVAFFALSQVRRSMVPLARLREGTQRLGRGDFQARVDISSGDEFEELAESFNTMAGQLKEQFDANTELVQALDRLNVGTLSALARTVDAKSPWTAGHSQRVTEMAVEIGRAMGLNRKALDDLARGGLLHDIGKIAVPTELLNKEGPLTPEEFAVMKEHPRIGARILEPIPEYGHLIPIVLQHHEWVDGSGYPFGLAGDAIDLNARVLAVADVYDALTSKRPYREALSHHEAVSIIADLDGRQFDRRVVNAFFDMLEVNGVPRREHEFAEAVLAKVRGHLVID
jgi:putative nucleotidyltransferase with HDIG domain